jgi:hypothetical protein
MNEPLVEREFGERLFFVSKRSSHGEIAPASTQIVNSGGLSSPYLLKLISRTVRITGWSLDAFVTCRPVVFFSLSEFNQKQTSSCDLLDIVDAMQ